MKTLCPLCSDTLLRHLKREHISWFCLRCHQEMPNMNLINFNRIQHKMRQSDRCLDNYVDSKIKLPIDSICQTIQYQSNTIDLFIGRNKKRLEVVGFIMNKIDLLLVNMLLNRQAIEVDTKSISSKVKSKQGKATTSIEAKFLRDSEFILLRICYAILLSDRSIITSMITQEARTLPANLNLQIEKTYFIDLIKTLVIDFVKSITLDSAPNLEYFSEEIAGYFELVIKLMLNSNLEIENARNIVE